jgi:hypothetical protein
MPRELSHIRNKLVREVVGFVDHLRLDLAKCHPPGESHQWLAIRTPKQLKPALQIHQLGENVSGDRMKVVLQRKEVTIPSLNRNR